MERTRGEGRRRKHEVGEDCDPLDSTNNFFFFSRYVLQNHSLFLIAEQPPADMASLLVLFKPSVPPVVKRRSKELLTIIAEAVKKSFSSTQPSILEPETSDKIQIEQVDETGTQEDVVMRLEAGVKKPELENGGPSNIWGGMFLLSTSPYNNSASRSKNEKDRFFCFNISFVIIWSPPVCKIFKGTYYTTCSNHYWDQLIVRQQGWKAGAGESAPNCTAAYSEPLLRRRFNVPRLVQTVPTLQRWLPKSIVIWSWHLLSLR